MPSMVAVAVERIADLFIEKGGVTVTPQSVQLILAASAANQALGSAVTGKRSRLLSLVVSSRSATATDILIKDASGGASLLVVAVPGNTSDEPNVILIPNKYGWCDTTAGNGLFVDVGSAEGVNVSARVAQFTP